VHDFELKQLRHRTAAGDGIRLHYAEGGSGPAVVLLHGFPDFWYGWRHQIPALVAGGFRVIVPDLRGYNASDRPTRVQHYALPRLAADVAALIRDVAGECAAVAGHDWGGLIGWSLAAREPGLMQRLVILNAPHPDGYIRTLLRHPRQVLRSWYVLASQLPALPEAALRARDFALLKRVLRYDEDGIRMAAESELQCYVEAFAAPGALTAALAYYRAAVRGRLRGRRAAPGRVRVPVLVLWGERDRFLDVRLLEGLPRYAPELRIERLPKAGHFLHWQDAPTVNRLLLRFLSSRPVTAADGSPAAPDAGGTARPSGR
jgi:epoxide hydrolase 4